MPNAVTLLVPLTRNGHGTLLFPGERSHDRPISDNTLRAALLTLGYGPVYDGAKHVVIYDKLQQIVDLNARRHTNKPLPFDPTTRIEIRLRPDVGLVQLELFRDWKRVASQDPILGGIKGKTGEQIGERNDFCKIET